MKTVIMLIALLLSACGTAVNQNTAAVNAIPEPQATPDLELQNQIAEIAKEAKGKVGVSAIVLETGETVSLNNNERFPIQSVVKLPISMAVLKQIDEGKLKLDQNISVTREDFVPSNMHSPIRDANPNGAEITIRELMRSAVSESDGTACDVLMRVAGGAKAVQKYVDDLGIVEIEIKRTHKEFGKNWEMQYDNWSSPEGAIALLTALHAGDGISADHRELLLKFMTDTPTGPNRLKGLLPAGTVVAHKTGSGGTRDGITSATNDIGIIYLPNGKHIAIAVFVSDSPADEKTREGVIAKIAKAVWDKWSK
jgi:beta-lactamase class A